MSLAKEIALARALRSSVMQFEAGDREPLHTHTDCAQLKWPSNGLSRVRTPRGLFVVPPTHAMWIPPGHEHGGSYLRSVRECSLYVHEDHCMRLPSRATLVRLSPRLQQEIESTMVRSSRYDGPASRTQDAATLKVLESEVRDSGARPLDLPLPNGDRVRVVLDALQHRPDDTSTAAQWAERLGLSERTFCRVFAQEARLAFGAFRKRARLLYALERLALGAGVTEVAAELGYNSDSAFIYMFRRSLGRTPNRYYA